MSNTQHRQPHPTVELPDQFDTSSTKLIYLYLRVENEATIDELQAALEMQKLTLYSLLKTLTATDLIDREGATYISQKQTPTGGTA